MSWLRSCIWVLACLVSQAQAEDVRVAVAANFAEPMGEIAKRFEETTGNRVVLSSGSTGKLYAQIIQGAPFDAFFAADAERPRLLEEAGKAVKGSRFTYAIGKILLWSVDPDLVDQEGKILSRGEFRRLSIANPRLAPYGKAAEEVLTGMGLWKALQPRLVQGENISQAFHFVFTGNAELGFVAASQVLHPKEPKGGSYWEPPTETYSPIEQQAVLLGESPVAQAFMEYCRTKEVGDLLRSYGYLIHHD